LRCRLLTGDFELSFLRRFGKVINFAVSFRMTRFVGRWVGIIYDIHNMVFFKPGKYLSDGVVIVLVYNILFDLLSQDPYPPTACTELRQAFIVLSGVYSANAGDLYVFPEDLLFPLVCILYYFPSSRHPSENIKICIRDTCICVHVKKNLIIIITRKYKTYENPFAFCLEWRVIKTTLVVFTVFTISCNRFHSGALRAAFSVYSLVYNIPTAAMILFLHWSDSLYALHGIIL